MKIVTDAENGTWTFVPKRMREEIVIHAIAEILKPGDKIAYGGRSGIGDKLKLYLYSGSKEIRKTTKKGNVSFTESAFIQGRKLILRGSNRNDRDEVCAIRDVIYFGSGGLIYLGQTEIDGVLSIIVTGTKCKHCENNTISLGECHWKTCKSCCAKCEHHYIRSTVIGTGFGIAMGEFCDICGDTKPWTDEQNAMSNYERHREVEFELGVIVID